MATGALIGGIVAGVAGTASAGVSLYESEKASTAASKIDTLNRQTLEAQNREEVRRARNEQKVQEGRARSIAAAAGLDSRSGSLEASLTGLYKENKSQLSWLKTAGSSALTTHDATASARKREGNARTVQAGFGVVSSAASGVNTVSKAGVKAGIWK